VVGSTVLPIVTPHCIFTEADSIKHILTNLQNKQALFLNRNPRVGLIKPQGRRINRLISFSPDAMKKYLKKNLALVRGKTSSLKGKFLM
jgi:hypothetical protein